MADTRKLGNESPDARLADALLDVVESQLRDHRAAASIGCLGALAEFHEPDAIHQRPAPHRLVARSRRGALAIEFSGDEALCAYEAPSAHGDAWQYGLAVLAPGRRGAAREALTELGPDHDALDETARDAVLFDLGLGMPNVDYCVRVSDPHLLATLREHRGECVTASGHPLQAALVAASPPRVVISPVARIEVYQPIARDRTPEGSHTHLLPDLLARRRTHPANLPLPPRALPLLTVHPQNPLFDEHGERRGFDVAAFARFERLLAAHGLPDYVAAKAGQRARLMTDGVAALPRPATRLARAALRAVLRQAPHLDATVHAADASAH